MMLAYYNKLLESGQIKPDPAQKAIADRLAELGEELAKPAAKSTGWFRKKPAPVKGLFIFGKVGRGKSMLMDAFYQSVPITEKKRVHFHEFMQDVHGKLHTARESGAGIESVAKAIAGNLRLLCFDEYEVNDVTDAMILAKLFREITARGVVLVFTSNKPPEDHYREGLQRDSYLEFCHYLRTQVEVVSLDSKRDYRLNRAAQAGNYFTPLGFETTTALKEKFKSMTAEPVQVLALDIGGRQLKIRASGKIAIAEFQELCGENLGNADYIALAEKFDVLFLENIPQMNEDLRNEARRFINLIDILYEHKTMLIASAAVQPADLDKGNTAGFEFARTTSRLSEMQSWKRRDSEERL